MNGRPVPARNDSTLLDWFRAARPATKLSFTLFVLSVLGVPVVLGVQAYRGRRGTQIARVAFTSAAPGEGSARANPAAGTRVRVWLRQKAAYHYDVRYDPEFDRAAADMGPPVGYEINVTQGERVLYRATLSPRDCEYLSWGLGEHSGRARRYDRDCRTTGRFVAPGGEIEVRARLNVRRAAAIDRAEDLSVELYAEP